MTSAEFEAIQALIEPKVDPQEPVHQGARLFFVEEMQISHAAPRVGVKPCVLHATLRIYVAAKNRRNGDNGNVPLSEAQKTFLAAIGLFKIKKPGDKT